MLFLRTRRHATAVLVAAVAAAGVTVGVSTWRAKVDAGASADHQEDVRVAEAVARRPRTFTTVVPSTTASRPGATTPATVPPACPWLDSSLPVSTRVDELLAAMTPAEEAGLLHLHQIGTAVQYEGWTAAIPRLCIPILTEQDGAAGVGVGFNGVTQLPAPIADAAAFDPSLANRYGAAVGAEDAAKGIDMALAPTINIDRSPLWGRSYETLGEDPFLTASLAVPLVRGIQSNRVVSVVKHFAVYNQETHRATLQDDAIVTEQAQHEIYMPAFSAVTQHANPGGMMCAYNLINGTPACEDAALIDQTLRQEWHFSGFVRSDCGSIYAQAPAIAVGVSQVKCSALYNPVELARLPKTTLDGLARPLLTVLFRYDLIAAPHPENRNTIVTTPEHVRLATLTADEGAVLLRNQGNLLPLDFAHLGSLALIGPSDGTPMPAGFGAMYVLPTHPVSALAALRAELGDRVRYDAGTDLGAATALARRSQVAVVVVHDVEAERYDRTTLQLPGQQDRLVAAVAAANPRTIVVVESGGAVLMPWIRSVAAILETWYPGQSAGTSLADLLSGRVDPGGKLPVTFPASMAAMPDNSQATFGGVGGRVLYSDGIDVGYRWYQAHGVTPAFSFGFGLSYTQFRFSGLAVKANRDGSVGVTATISNVGTRSGVDVVQCYVGDPPATGEPARQLRGFQRVDLAPHASQTVHLTLTAGDLAVWSTATHAWEVPGGTYRVFVGDGSDPGNLPLTQTLSVPAAQLGPASGPAT